MVVICLVICAAGNFAGCKDGFKKGPNIRKVKLDIQVDHFEEDFFGLQTKTNALQFKKGLAVLKAKYGPFYEDFLYNIAAFSMGEPDSVLYSQIRDFIMSRQPIYDSIAYYIPHLDKELKKIENALKRARVYFPELPLPGRVITYIGPIDGFGSFASEAGLCVGLQQFLGPNFPGYQSDYLLSLFGKQRLQQFSPDYLAPLAIETWINREFPDQAGHYSLKDKMIEEGRKLYVLKSLLPNQPDSLIFGYSASQMQWCQHNSYLIKRYFEKEKLLKIKNPEIIVTYINDNQRPDSLPAEFPNNVGKYLGYLLVKNYMEDQGNTDLTALMRMEFWKFTQ